MTVVSRLGTAAVSYFFVVGSDLARALNKSALLALVTSASVVEDDSAMSKFDDLLAVLENGLDVLPREL
jgi:hypothetical protein